MRGVVYGYRHAGVVHGYRPYLAGECALGGVRYRGGMTDDYDEGVAAVTRQDVVTLLDQLQPGTVHSSADLYKRFIRNLKGTFRPVPHATALGHALRAAGCESKRVRMSRGSRKNRVVTEVASWVIPGTPARDLVNPVTDLVIGLGEGDHHEDEVFRQYKLMYWNRGWGTAPLSRYKLLVELTNMGVPRVASGQHVRRFPTTVR